MLYLASTSPRRRRLLDEAGLHHVTVEPGPEPTGEGTPLERALQRAISKAVGARADGAPGFVLGVDTVVEIDGNELGKARDRPHAVDMLRRLGGREHLVHTAHCLRAAPDDGRRFTRTTTARVAFDPLDEERLRRFLDTDAWVGKAGAYGIQDEETEFARLVSGDRDTVVGLSVRAVRELLAEAAREVL